MTDQFPLSDKQVLDYVDGDNDAIFIDNRDALYDYYTSHERGSDQMPYGTAKARSGDPDEWMHTQLEKRAQAIRFFTDTSHPSVGDGERVRPVGTPMIEAFLNASPFFQALLQNGTQVIITDERSYPSPSSWDRVSAAIAKMHDKNEDGDNAND